jgi:DNA topoisomerase-1
LPTWGKVQVLNGPYGPYVTDGKNNARVPKEDDPKKITEKKAAKMLKEAAKNPKRNSAAAAFPQKNNLYLI